MQGNFLSARFSFRRRHTTRKALRMTQTIVAHYINLLRTIDPQKNLHGLVLAWFAPHGFGSVLAASWSLSAVAQGCLAQLEVSTRQEQRAHIDTKYVHLPLSAGAAATGNRLHHSCERERTSGMTSGAVGTVAAWRAVARRVRLLFSQPLRRYDVSQSCMHAP
jgi:hypothetical protein